MAFSNDLNFGSRQQGGHQSAGGEGELERFVGKWYKPREPGMEASVGERMPFLPQRRDQRLANETRSEDGIYVGRTPREGGIKLTEGAGRVHLGCAQRLDIRGGGRFIGSVTRKGQR